MANRDSKDHSSDLIDFGGENKQTNSVGTFIVQTDGNLSFDAT